MEKISVCITDDHSLFRRGLASLLQRQERIEVVKECANGAEIIEYLKNHNDIDVLLLDLTMPVLDGFEVLKIIREENYAVKVITLSMHNDGNYIVKSVKLGAQGYLFKNADDSELIQAIIAVHEGGKYFNQEVSSMMTSVMALGVDSQKKLSPKEFEVLNLLAEGLITKEIAEKLYISTRTVETHRANMMKKLEVKNTAELISKALKLHLIK